MIRVIGILFLLVLMSGCHSDDNTDDIRHTAHPSLAEQHIIMEPGQTIAVTVTGFDRNSLSHTVISGCNGIVTAEINIKELTVTALKGGETVIHVKPGTHPELNLKVTVSSDGKKEEDFTDATPRFSGAGYRLDCTQPGVMVTAVSEPQQWQIQNLNDNTSIIIDSKTMKINQTEFAVESLEMFTDKAETVNFLKINLKNGKEAWLVIRKELF